MDRYRGRRAFPSPKLSPRPKFASIRVNPRRRQWDKSLLTFLSAPSRDARFGCFPWGFLPGRILVRCAPRNRNDHCRRGTKSREEGIFIIAPVAESLGWRQAWNNAVGRYATRTSCRIPVGVLADTGVGGGNYASVASVRSTEHRGRRGQLALCSRGKGWLSAATPFNSAAPPMKVVASCDIPLVFALKDTVRSLSASVVEGLPHGLILGSPSGASTQARKHASAIKLAKRSGRVQPALGSSWILFVPRGGGEPSKGNKVVD